MSWFGTRYRWTKYCKPIGHYFSVAMMLRYTFREEAAAKAIEDAVGKYWIKACVQQILCLKA
jgi:3-isopropylmalate dehydrogenase